MPDDLFSHTAERNLDLTPLADRMRPRYLDDVAGQEHLLGKGRYLRGAIESDTIPSLIFWGPPGTGKTTLARVIANHTGAIFQAYSAVGGSVKEVRRILLDARHQRELYHRRTIFFVDEIHRFNKAQQDVLLPSVEQGIVTMIGATTENPSFSVVSALLSRCKVLTLDPLAPRHLHQLLQRALTDADRGLGALDIRVDDNAMDFLASSCHGDARYALGTLDAAVTHAQKAGRSTVDVQCVEDVSQAKALRYDKDGEEHYNVVSAFIKSMRGSDPNGALYWMFRMLDAGEDPLFVLRRMIIFASEDVGNADPRALQLVMTADAAFSRVGMPEGAYPLAQACCYLACAPKSNAMVDAIKGPRKDIEHHGPLPVPARLRNAPTKLMKELGYGDGYRYPPSEGGYAKGETYLPDALANAHYYRPSNNGLESKIAAHLKNLRDTDR